MEKQANSRRKALKGLLGLPVLGGVLWGAWSEVQRRKQDKQELLDALNIDARRPVVDVDLTGDPIRVGIIGFGGRGQHLVRVLGYATPAWQQAAKAQRPEALRAYREQENLNVKLTGVCDVFDVPTEEAVAALLKRALRKP